MAVDIVRRTHAHHFIKQLNRNERNALRVILLTDGGLGDLREALGTQRMQRVPVERQRTEAAMRGTTAELFRDMYPDILPLDRVVESGVSH